MKPRGYYINNVTGYSISIINEGLIIVVLENNCGGCIHTMVINKILNFSNDCMEEKELHLNHDNILKCYGFNRLFERCSIVVDLRYNKVHAKKLNMK